MEQKFGTAVAISERLIHTAYSNRLSPGALDHEALLAVVKYVLSTDRLYTLKPQVFKILLLEMSYEKKESLSLTA